MRGEQPLFEEFGGLSQAFRGRPASQSCKELVPWVVVLRKRCIVPRIRTMKKMKWRRYEDPLSREISFALVPWCCHFGG